MKVLLIGLTLLSAAYSQWYYTYDGYSWVDLANSEWDGPDIDGWGPQSWFENYNWRIKELFSNLTIGNIDTYKNYDTDSCVMEFDVYQLPYTFVDPQSGVVPYFYLAWFGSTDPGTVVAGDLGVASYASQPQLSIDSKTLMENWNNHA